MSVKKALGKIRHVNSAYCELTETKALRIVVLHDNGRDLPVLHAVIDRLMAAEDEFPDVDFRPVTLNEDQARYCPVDGMLRVI